MLGRRAVACALALCTLMTACASDPPVRVAKSESTAPGGGTSAPSSDGSLPTTTADPPAPSPSSSATSTTRPAPPTTGTPPASTPKPPRTTLPAGGDPDGVGDKLFPSLGNPGIDVTDYDVKLAWDPQAGELSGEVDISLTATADRTEFTLDSDGPDVAKVTVDGADATFRQDGEELRITPATPLSTGAKAVVDVTYAAHPTGGTSSVDLPSGWFPTEGGSYVLNEPEGARTWLPSSDHPSDKATWTFEITVPKGLTAVANGKHVGTTPGPKGDTWVWREDRPMATYLIQVLTGKYDLVEGTGPNGLPLLSAVLTSAHQEMQAEIDEISDQIAYFEKWFGPYPLDRYGIAITDSAPGLAMETQERSMFSDRDLVGDKGYEDELLLSHELAHQWFGDAVSPARWQDVWLNESFATYGQWMWLDHAGLDTLESQANQALQQRELIPGKTADPKLQDLFGYDVYEGGAIALEALRRTIGDDAFFTILKQWVAGYNGTSRTTQDFEDLASKVANTDLHDFFQRWIFATRPPSEFPSPKGGTPTSGTDVPAPPTT